MAARLTRPAQLCLPVGTRHWVEHRSYPRRAPVLAIGTGQTVITLTLPEVLAPGHVAFARHLAAQAAAYAVEVERRYRGLPSLPVPASA
jgi:hypothetical protein